MTTNLNNMTALEQLEAEINAAIAAQGASTVAPKKSEEDFFNDFIESEAGKLSVNDKKILHKGFSLVKAVSILKGMVEADKTKATNTKVEYTHSAFTQALLATAKNSMKWFTFTTEGEIESNGDKLKAICQNNFQNLIPAMQEAGKYLVSEGYKGSNKYPTNDCVFGTTKLYTTPFGFRVSIHATESNLVAKRALYKNLHITLTERHLGMGNPLHIIADSVRVHKVSTTHGKDAFGNKTTQYGEAISFTEEELLPLMLSAKEAGIDIVNIIANQGKKTAVLSMKARTGTFKLNTIECPQVVLAKYYADKTSAKLSEATKGILIEPKSVPNLIEYVKASKGGNIMVTLEPANKTINRDDKMNNSKKLFSADFDTFVVLSTVGLSKAVNEALDGGNVVTSNSVALDLGDCRVVSDTLNGGNKSALLPIGKNSCSAKGDFVITSSAALKGGLVGLHSMLDQFNTPKLKDILQDESLMNDIFKDVFSVKETITFNGETLVGVWVNTNFIVTNSGTLDSYVAVNAEDEGLSDIDLAKKTADRIIDQIIGEYVDEGVRAAYINARQHTGVGVAEWIKSELKAKRIKLKETKTRVGIHELEFIRNQYGKDKAIEVADLLIDGLDNSTKATKDVAMQFLGLKEKDVVKTVSINDIRDAIDHNIILNNSVTADQALALVDLLKGKEGQLIEIVSNSGESTHVPAGYALVADMEKEANKVGATYVPMKGLIKDIILSINDDSLPGTILENIQANTQATLLGKNLGYLEVKGWYGNILPFIGGHKNVVGMTRRGDLIKSSNTIVQVTMVKNPLYFKWMACNYNAVNFSLGDSDLDNVFRRALFVNTKLTLTFKNDFDGDQMRVSVDFGLELAGDLTQEFNGDWFNAFVVGEMGGNIFTPKPVHKNTLESYNKAIFNAVNSKKLIGSLTSNAYLYSIAFANFVGTSFTLVSNPEYTATFSKDNSNKLLAILNMLVQTEGMDNVKQDGSQEVFSKALNYHFMQDSQNPEASIAKAYSSLAKTRIEYDLDLTDEEIVLFAEALYAAAVATPTNYMVEYALFNNRNMKINRFDVIEFGAEKGKPKYVFENIGEKAINASKDKASMYAYLIEAFKNI